MEQSNDIDLAHEPDHAQQHDTFASAEECSAIVDSEEKHWPQEEGDTVALIHTPWFEKWAEYASFRRDTNGEPATICSPLKIQHIAPRPGAIDNSPLLDASDGELREGLAEGTDFTVINKATWELLHKWYAGGPEIFRECAVEGAAEGGPRKVVAAVYFLRLTVHRSKGDNTARIIVSKQMSISDLKLKACKAMGLEEGDVRIWDFWSNSRHALLEGRLDDSAQAAKLFDNQDILLEEKVDGEFEGDDASGPLLLGSPASPMYASPPATGFGPSSLRTTASFSEDSVSMEVGRPRGQAGLSNLGNTCFMNSSVQCLAHSVPIMHEFLGGKYMSELNRSNPLGRGGKLAEAFGGLIEKLWQGGLASVTPRGFKAAIANFAPQFTGYSQHDSQELLAFLLDGLHEDLNRVADKRYIEDNDYTGQPDEEWANEAWDNYRKNNDSVIVDHFQGMYKSTLVCPECSHCSVKFDPAMYLTLPLPMEKTRTAEVNIVHVDGSVAPALHAVDVPKAGTIGDLYAALAQALGIAPGDADSLLLLVDIWEKKIDKRYTDMDAPVSDALGNGSWRYSAPVLIAYRYPTAELGPKSTTGEEVMVFHRQRKFSAASSPLVFAPPLLLWLPKEGIVDSMDSAQATELEKRSFSFGGPDSEYIVGSHTEVGTAIQAALRPLKRRKVEDTNGSGHDTAMAGASGAAAASDALGSAADAAAGATANGDREMEDMTEDIEDVAALPPQTPGRSAAAQAAAAAAEKRAAAGTAMQAAAPDGTGCEPPAESEWEEVEPPPASVPKLGANSSPKGKLAKQALAGSTAGRPSTPAQTQAVPYSLTNGDGAHGAAPQTVQASIPAAAPAHGAFDMFPARAPAEAADPDISQTGSDRDAANGAAPAGGAAGGSAEAPQPPYTLKRALKSGECRFARGASSTGLDGPPWYVSVDFAHGADDQFDLAAMESPPQDASVAAARARRQRGPPPIPLSDCIQAHLQPEQLDEANSWYCPKCKKHQQATKKLDLWTLPEVLVVHLKRFAAGRITRDKLDALVQFPLAGLDLSPYVLRSQEVAPMYDLYAVSNHFGGLGGGHYTAFVNLPGTGDEAGGWFNFDDNRVTGPLSDSEIVCSSAYLLFYRRREETQKDDGARMIASVPQPGSGHGPAAMASSMVQPSGGSAMRSLAEPGVHTADSGGNIGGGAGSLSDFAGLRTPVPSGKTDAQLGAGPSVGGPATGSSSSLENMGGRSSSEHGDLDFDMDLPESAAIGDDGPSHSPSQPGGMKDEATTQRHPLAELGSGKQSHPGSGLGPAANLGGSHLSKGSWANLGVIGGDGSRPGSAAGADVNGGDLSDADDLYS